MNTKMGEQWRTERERERDRERLWYRWRERTRKGRAENSKPFGSITAVFFDSRDIRNAKSGVLSLAFFF